MPITVNKPVHTALHRREADGSATPLHPVTSAGAVGYVNTDQAAAFDGSTASEALDALFRRMAVVETEALPPALVTPRLLTPEADAVLQEGDLLRLTATPFATSAGRDTHAASEWRIHGADGRQLWNSGSRADALEAFPAFAVTRTTLPDITGATDGERLRLEAVAGFVSLCAVSLFRETAGGGVRICWEDAASYSSSVATLHRLTRSTDNGVTWGRTACADTSPLTALVWTGTRFLAFLKSNTATSSTATLVMASEDGGDSWTRVGSLPVKNTNVRAAALDGVVVAGSGATWYRSTDNGVTWVAVSVPVTSPTTLRVAHGHFLMGVTANQETGAAAWAASRDGRNWSVIAALAGMNAVTADATGLVGVRVTGGNAPSATFARVTGENFQTTDAPATAFAFPFAVNNSNLTPALIWDAESGLYTLAFSNNNANNVLLCGAACPRSAADAPTLEDAGWTPLPLATRLPGVASISNAAPPTTLYFGGRAYVLLNLGAGGAGNAGPDWPEGGGTMLVAGTRIFALRPRREGTLFSETLRASARYEGRKAGWSDWSPEVAFTAALAADGGGEDGALEERDSVTFHTRCNSLYGNVLSTTFTVPDGVTELLLLCASGVASASQPGRAASCRVTVTPGQVIPISVGGYDISIKKVITTTSVGDFITCEPAGVTCPSGTIMEFQGAAGSGTSFKGGGVAFVTDAEWRRFALHGTTEQPGPVNAGNGLNAGWNGFTNLYSFCGGTGYAYGQSGLVKIWWGDQIAGA